MSPHPSPQGYRAYLRFLAWTVGMAAGIALVGWLPTARWGGPNAVRAMLAGCGVGAIASALGGIPVLVFGVGGTGGAVGIVASMAVRFTVALGLALAAALSGLFARGPLMIWVALSYLVLLVADTRFALVSSTSEQEK